MPNTFDFEAPYKPPKYIEELNKKVDLMGRKLYSHNFDVSFGNDIAPWVPEGNRVDINFNVISNEDTKFLTLSEIDGAGYIASAFGVFQNMENNQPDYTNIVEAKLFYSNVSNGSLLVELYNINSYSSMPFVVSNLNDYALLDSVQAIN